ncbi:MAG: ABC transporter permease [Chloroflexota bacterium]
MKKIFAIAWKDAIIRFASKAELLYFVILPVVFTFLLAGGTPSGDEDNRIRLLVSDQARSELSAQIIAQLSASTAVRPEVQPLDEAQAQFDERRASVLLVIPADFSLQSLQEGAASLDLRMQPNDLNGSIAQRAVQTAIRKVSSAVNAANQAVNEAEAARPFASDAERQAYFDRSLELATRLQTEAPERVAVVQGSTPDQVEYDPAANSFAGQLITWVFIPLFGISALFAYERNEGTLRRLLTTPTRRSTYLLGVIGGQVTVALAQMLILVGFGILVMKLNWGRDPAALAVILVAAALAAGAIGTTMGTFIKTEGQASGLSIMAGMVMALMGGCWYPLELFPQAVQSAVRVLPTTWAMQGMLDLVLRGGGLAEVLPEAGVLLGFAAVFFTVGVLRFRYE